MLILLPYRVDVPYDRLPIANWIIIAATLITSLAVFATPEPALSEALNGKQPWWAAWVLSRDTFAFPQLLGYVFLHAGYIHLIGNMIFLFCFGNAVNSKLGHVLYIGAYFTLGALGGLAWLIFGTGIGCIGASGAIMGVVGMFLVYFPRNNVAVLYFFWLIYCFRAGLFVVSSFWMILLYSAFDVLGLLLGGERIAYEAHLGSAIAGVIAGAAFLLLGLTKSTMTEQNLLELLRLAPGRGGARAEGRGRVAVGRQAGRYRL